MEAELDHSNHEIEDEISSIQTISDIRIGFIGVFREKVVETYQLPFR